MMGDSITFNLVAHAEIVVSTKVVLFRWCDADGVLHTENIGRTAIARILAKTHGSQKPKKCAQDGTEYPGGFDLWTNAQRCFWLDEHSLAMAAHV